MQVTYEQIKDTGALPSPSGVALEILRLVENEGTTIETIAALIERDPALSARLLRLVNAPCSGVSRRVGSILLAAKLLGLRTVKTLALGFSLLSNNRAGRCVEFDYEWFWSESLGRAVAVRNLTAHLSMCAPDVAFTIGLLSRIGRLALATAFPGEYARALQLAASGKAGGLARIERELFQLDHNDLAADMLSDWRLPPVFCDAVRFQDSPELDTAQLDPLARQLAQTVHLGGLVARVLSRGGAGPAAEELAGQVRALSICPETFAQLFETIRQAWQEMGEVLEVQTREPHSPGDFHGPTPAHSGSRAGRTPGFHAAPSQGGPGTEALRILVVDDDPASLRLMEECLTAEGYRVVSATNGAEALEIDLREAPQMIIADWMMPAIDGLELCRRLRAQLGGAFVYIIIATAHSDRDRNVEALEAGANEFLSKPYKRDELMARVRAGERTVRLHAELARKNHEILYYNTMLDAANARLETMATTDELTGLINRREGLLRLDEHWAAAARTGNPLCCVMLDIDYFKHVNDTYGHDVGDLVLAKTARVLRATARTEETVCRLGGEEFLIICPNSTVADAQQLAERLRAAVRATIIKADDAEVTVTVSVAVAKRTSEMRNPGDLLKAADETLYAAKHAGRDRVSVAAH